MNSEAGSRQPKKRRWIKIALLCVGAIIGLSILAVLTACVVADLKLKRAIADAEEAGLPTTWEGVRDLLPKVDQTRARQQAFYLAITNVPSPPSEMSETLLVEGIAKFPELGEPLPSEILETLEKRLAQVDEPLSVLAEAIREPPFLFKEGMHSGLYQYDPRLMGSTRAAARLFKMRAIAAAARNDPEAALRAVEDGFCLAESLDTIPNIIAFFVHAACEGLAYSSLEFTLAHTDPTEEQLKSMEQMILKSDIDMKTVLKGDMVSDLGMHRHMMSDPDQMATIPRLFNDSVWFYVMKLEPLQRAWVKMSATYMLRDTSCVIELWGLPWEEFEKQCNTRIDKPPDLFTSTMLDASFFISLRGHELSMQAKRSCALLAMAIERYSQKTGTLPSTLSDLVPDYIAEIPVEPFKGNNVGYATTNGVRGIISFSRPDRDKPYEFVVLSGTDRSQ